MLDATHVNHNRPRTRVAIALGAVLAALVSGTLAATPPPEAAAFPPPPDPPETTVKIVQPANGTQTLYGGMGNHVHFAATATRNGIGCCTITWRSNVDGLLGSGKTLDYGFSTPGTRIVTATATAPNGLPGSATVTVVAKNTPPAVSIRKPAANVLYRNVAYKFQGDSHDANEPFGLPCSSLVWSTTPFTQWQPPMGCSAMTKFPNAGIYKVRLNANDAYGLPAPPAIKTITVKDKPKQSAPSVTLVQPDDDAALNPGTKYTLNAIGSDVDNDPIAYTWTITYGSTTKVIGNGAQFSWRPADDISFTCGGRSVTLTVTASDNDGVGDPDSVSTHILWGPC
jgi:hypothetical protein